MALRATAVGTGGGGNRMVATGAQGFAVYACMYVIYASVCVCLLYTYVCVCMYVWDVNGDRRVTQENDVRRVRFRRRRRSTISSVL